MAEEEAPFLPGAEDSEEGIEVSFRPRRHYLRPGTGRSATAKARLLLQPKVARELRTAAEFATQEGRVNGRPALRPRRGRRPGRLPGHHRAFIEAGPGENSGDRLSSDGTDDFTLSEADLRLLREDAARMYSASLELGWWRTRADLGDFGPGDYLTQAELIGPDGVGLLVYGSGIHWGTAYLGPDGHAPDSAGTLVEAPGAAAGSDPGPPGPGPALVTEAPLAPEPELVDIAAGERLRRVTRKQVVQAAPGRVGLWPLIRGSGCRGSGCGRGGRRAGSARGPRRPADVQVSWSSRWPSSSSRRPSSSGSSCTT